MKNFRHSMIFILMLIVLAIYYDYPSRYYELPMAINHSTSIALNYYQNGMNFFKPQVHNLMDGAGYFVAEFPIISYVVALLYKWFGVEEGLFRLVNFLILGVGLLALSKMVWQLTKDEMYSFFVPMILMGMPLFAFHAFGFSTNTAALSFLLMGFHSFFKYYESGKIRHWFWAGCFFLLSGLLNWALALMVLPLLIIFILEWTELVDFKANKEIIFKQKLLAVIPFFIVLVGVVSWTFFSQQYNSKITNDTQSTTGFDNLLLLSVFIIISLTSFGIFIKSRWTTLYSKWLWKWSLVILTLMCIFYAQKQVFYPMVLTDQQRDFVQLETSITDFSPKEIQAFLAEHQIIYPTKVISAIDFSKNTSLYCYNLTGWTTIDGELNEDFIKKSVEQGAQYLIAMNKQFLNTLPPSITQHPIANYKHQIFVFDIQHLK